MFEKEIVVDGKGHMLGRLASVVAKELLCGQRVVIVRCERICQSGSLYRKKVTFHEFLRKKMVHNPWRGAVHYRSPSRMMWRAIRGMLPHKSPRGAAALGNSNLENT
jgi:large subunit ribosomal protein L13Ae